MGLRGDVKKVVVFVGAHHYREKQSGHGMDPERTMTANSQLIVQAMRSGEGRVRRSSPVHGARRAGDLWPQRQGRREHQCVVCGQRLI